MTDKEWLDNLKVGDDVAVKTSHFTGAQYKLTKVERITKTRQVKVESQETKFKDGVEIGRHGIFESRCYIVPITDEVRDHMARERIISKLCKINYKELSTEKLIQIHKIIND